MRVKNQKTNSKDKAANTVTKEMIFSQLKNKSEEDSLKLYKRLEIIFSPILNTGTFDKQFTDLNKDELFTKLNNVKTNYLIKKQYKFSTNQMYIQWIKKWKLIKIQD